jgi:hypothetical protein
MATMSVIYRNWIILCALKLPNQVSHSKRKHLENFRGKSVVGNKVYNIYISKVLIVPGLEINLLSVRKLEMQGLAVVFKQG